MIGTLTEVTEEIIRIHVPDEEAEHWADERRCRGCGLFIYLPIGGFPRHQADLIVREVRDRLGTR